MKARRMPRRTLLFTLALALLASLVPAAVAATRTGRPTRHARHRTHAPRRRRHQTARVQRTRTRRTTSTTTSTGSATTTTTTTSTTTVGATTGGPSPSGVPMPTSDPTGWHTVFSDDFTGSALDTSSWHTYWGQPGGDSGGWFDPNHLSVAGGELTLSGYQDAADGGKWATAGLSTTFAQTYGKYLVRFRFDSGVGIAHAILLWPADGSWPPEVDFSEDNGSNRQTDYATLHYGASNSTISSSVGVDLTQWHTLGVEWTPGRLVYTLDGQPWSTVTNANVPSIPMVLGIQTQAWACGTSTWEQCPNSTTPPQVNLYVDWVVAYAPN